MLGEAHLERGCVLFMGERISEISRFPPSPLFAPDVAGLPPTVIAVAGHDALRPEGIAYAQKLRDAGVAVTLLELDDMFHMFFGFARAAPGADKAIAKFTSAFAALLNQSVLAK